MKKNTLTLIGFLLVVATFIKSTNPPKYTLEEVDAIKVYNQLGILKEVLPQSELPAKQVGIILKQTDSLQGLISTQYVKFHPQDTTKTKK